MDLIWQRFYRNDKSVSFINRYMIIKESLQRLLKKQKQLMIQINEAAGNDDIPDLAGGDPIANPNLQTIPWQTPPSKVKSAYNFFAVITDEDDTVIFVKAPALMEPERFWVKLGHFLEDEFGVTGDFDILGKVPRSVALHGQLNFDEYDEIMNGRVQSDYTNIGGNLGSTIRKRYH